MLDRYWYRGRREGGKVKVENGFMYFIFDFKDRY